MVFDEKDLGASFQLKNCGCHTVGQESSAGNLVCNRSTVDGVEAVGLAREVLHLCKIRLFNLITGRESNKGEHIKNEKTRGKLTIRWLVDRRYM